MIPNTYSHPLRPSLLGGSWRGAILDNIALSREELERHLLSLPYWRAKLARAFKHEQGKKECTIAYELLCQMLREEYGTAAGSPRWPRVSPWPNCGPFLSPPRPPTPFCLPAPCCFPFLFFRWNLRVTYRLRTQMSRPFLRDVPFFPMIFSSALDKKQCVWYNNCRISARKTY